MADAAHLRPALNVPAVLLTAGTSRRMGTAKALLPGPDGLPMVRRVARALREGGASPVVVVTAPDETGRAVAEQAAQETDTQVVTNPCPGRGMLSSVQVGIRQALIAVDGPSPGAFLVTPCDLPRLEASQVAAVLAAWDGDKETIIAPVNERKRGHPTLFGVELAGEILSLDPVVFGLNEILRRHAQRVCEVVIGGDGAALRDADTPDEWQALVGSPPMPAGVETSKSA